MEKTKKKYLLVYLKTGGGHLAPARAIYNYMNAHYSDSVEPKLIYGFEKTPRWVQYIIEDGYRMLQYTGKWFFEFLYALNKISIVGKISCGLVGPFMNKYLQEVILKEQPDKIIIFHFFLLKPIFKILKEQNLDIKVYTVITDPFTPHPMWFHIKKQNFVVFSEQLKKEINSNHSGNLINAFPFILDDKYSKPADSGSVVDMKRKLEFDESKKIVLIIGGGDGIPKGKKILEGLLKANLDAQIAIVCGRNDVLFKSANDLKRKYNADNLKIYGYVDFIYELINISDVVITKCGASTIMEILNLKKVPVVNDYIWEQELGNVDYLINKKLGVYEPKLKKIPDVVKNLLFNDGTHSQYRENIINEKIKNGVREVTEFFIQS